MLEHGGRLRSAAAHYGIDLNTWLDLSTGINPNGWPVPAIPQSVWTRLPEENDGLEAAARAYYGTDYLLPVAGSQAAIQLLPRLFVPSRVSVIAPGYAEHQAAWQRAGHAVSAVSAAEIDAVLQTTEILVLINPNNPTAQFWSPAQLLEWHARLAARGGYLIVDEAFVDATPEISLVSQASRRGRIVLRSLGKFFGLAGARAGFVCAEQAILDRLRHLLGPWHLSGPARWVAKAALEDRVWQDGTRKKLINDSARLNALLAENGLIPNGGCALFHWVQTPQVAAIHEVLARRGILTRLFAEESGLRFGLPGDESQWQRLAAALSEHVRPFIGMHT
jgi:cobalamin biosynthetic protein CobC